MTAAVFHRTALELMVNVLGIIVLNDFLNLLEEQESTGTLIIRVHVSVLVSVYLIYSLCKVKLGLEQ